MKSLTDVDFLEELLTTVEEPVTNGCVVHNYPEQFGPLRHFDTESRCASRGCSSPTHFKLQGISYCMIHCLRKMNQMLIDSGVDK